MPEDRMSAELRAALQKHEGLAPEFIEELIAADALDDERVRRRRRGEKLAPEDER